jgi:hypothetical protein
MHGNRRYVKLALIGAVACLGIASPARAEVVTAQADHGVLGLAADGTPYVAWTRGRDLYVSWRANTGRWRQFRAGRLPGTRVTLAGIRVGEKPHRLVTVLTEDLEGAWIALARGSRITTLALAGRGSSFGPAGLTLDARQRPAVAYAVQRSSGKTYLRLVTFDPAGHPRTRGITREGFPSSDLPPGAAPVLVGRSLHVVETYTSSAIDWGPKRGGGWEGQFIFGSIGGSPQGLVGATYLAPTLWAAWTQIFPAAPPDDISVLLTSSAATQETTTLTHGIFVSIARTPGATQPEVGAYDWVTLGENLYAYAGLVVLGAGVKAWQLDGRLEGFAVGRAGTHQLLLAREDGLEWFRSPAPALPSIAIQAAAVDASGVLAGSVAGGTTGTVQVYRELGNGARELAATAPLAPDATFRVSGLSPSDVYRIVYVEPQTGIPFGHLFGVAVG